MKEIKLKGFNNLEIFTRVFDNVKDPKGVVQIIHGMREHSGRYIRFAEMLEKNGYIVIAPDQRGHGRTAKSLDLLGHGENDIYLECVEDHKLISEAIKEKYPNLPLYIFAHSFGSMVAQKYIQDCSLNMQTKPEQRFWFTDFRIYLENGQDQITTVQLQHFVTMPQMICRLL